MEYETFREEVRTFLKQELTEDLRRAGSMMTSVFAEFDATMAWHRKLYARGWVAPDWPAEHGGTDWDVNQFHIFQEECKLAGAPSVLPMGVQMLGPMLIRYGTEAQKSHYLPRILSGEDIWCQGYSEPGAGSDLASLQTSALRDGDDYLVNGSKIWTSYAHHSNMIFCLVRTSREGKPQRGISFLLIDMATPGITVAPITGLDRSVEQCQVFFEDVRVPVANLVGEENEGWAVAKYLLEFERGGQNYSIDLKKQAVRIRDQAQGEQGSDGLPVLASAVFQARLAELEIDMLALEATELRIKGAVEAGSNPGALSSLVKVVGTELSQKFNELSLDAVGEQAIPFQPDALDPSRIAPFRGPDYALTAMAEYINNRASTIYGGTAEIQREIIAKHVLSI
ncbi:MAG: acyl-CoA dehydrogenase family protein [Chromatocurvus sp.]